MSQEIQEFDTSKNPNPSIEEELAFYESQQNTESLESKDSPEVEPDTNEESLILGKFKTPEDLAQAYKELEKRLGSNQAEDSNGLNIPQQTSDEPDYSAYYGEGITKLAQEAGLDLKELNQEYSNEGKFSEETLDKLQAAGFGRDFMSVYLDGLSFRGQQQQQQESQQIQQIYDSLGGESNFNEVKQWVASSLDENEIAQYNKLAESGDLETLNLVLKGYQSRMQLEKGFGGKKLLTGQKPSNESNYFESSAQAQAAIDKRDSNGNLLYAIDAAYRAKVDAMIGRSDI